MEKDSDLLETGAMGVGVKRCELLPGNGSVIEATGRNLLSSIQVLVFATCKKSDELLFHTPNDGWFTANLIYTSSADKQRRSDKDAVVLKLCR